MLDENRSPIFENSYFVTLPSQLENRCMIMAKLLGTKTDDDDDVSGFPFPYSRPTKIRHNHTSIFQLLQASGSIFSSSCLVNGESWNGRKSLRKAKKEKIK